MKKFSLLLLTFCAAVNLLAAQIRVEVNGQLIRADFKDVATGTGLRQLDLQRVNAGLRSSHICVVGDSGKNWQQYEISFTPGASGEVKLLLRGKKASSKKQIEWVDYDHLEVSGAQLHNPSFEQTGNDVVVGWQLRKPNMVLESGSAAHGKNFVRAEHDFYVAQNMSVTAGKKVTLRFRARTGAVEKMPAKTSFFNRKVEAQNPFITNHPQSYYRYYDKKVKLLPLRDKGIRPEMIELGRPPEKPLCFPEADFAVPAPGKKSDFALRVPLELLEESGVSRLAEVRCGIPLPESKFFDLSQLQIIAPDGKSVPAQFSAMAFWKDRSVKWVLAQFPADLKAHEKSTWFLVAAKDQVPAAASPLKLTELPDRFLIDTGKMSAVISKKSFAMLSDIKVNGRNVGSFLPLTIRDEHGTEWNTAALAPQKISVEESGARRICIKISGSYGNSPAAPGSYVIRIGFTADSAVADFTITHVNSRLTTEFTDLTSIVLPFVPADPARILTMDFAPGSAMQTLSMENGRFFQQDEKTVRIYDSTAAAQLTGAGSVNNTLTFALEDAAFRYPKAFSLSNNTVNFELLPELPDAKFGTELPHYLQFPFCEGKYRLKWGMSFTERLKIDFSGAADPQTLAAKAVIPVIDRGYLAATGVIPGISVENIFAQWDKRALEAFNEYMNIKVKQREYGFLNYGDWFGERGRNWGNNEYDMAHGLFMLFSRTGCRDLFRWALIAARHQADVDIIHAYVDPVFVGTNAQHGIGHTGVNHQRVNPATWSWPLDYSFLGKNGHSWSNGMLDAWCFAGDAVVMDSALKLGEHFCNITAERLQELGTHERSAGWSVKALMSYYRVTGEQKYLDAAKKLVALALREQKFDKGGAWPHKLPGGHSGGYKNTYGNTPFLIGTLLAALRDYHLITGDPAVARSIIAAGKWQQLNWSDAACGFPYTASWDNKPYFPHNYGLNGLVAPGISYRALLTGENDGFEIIKKIIDLDGVIGISPPGKVLAMKLVYAADIMEDIMQFQKKYPDAPAYKFTPERIFNSFQPQHLSFKARGPEHKEFYIVLTASKAEVTVKRKLTGSRPDPKPQWSYKLIAPDGKLLSEVTGSVKDDYTEKLHLEGTPGDVFKLAISDDLTSFWDIQPGAGFNAFFKLAPQGHFNAAHPAAYYFTVPGGIKDFTITLGGVHAGPFNGWVINPDGKIVETVSGMNAHIAMPWMKSAYVSQAAKIIPGNKETEVWKLLIFTSGDIRISVAGIPPYLSTVPQPWMQK